MQPLFGIATPANWKPSQKPERCQAYLRFIRRKPCLGCNTRKNVEAAHTGPHGIGEKASDYRAVPLCHEHHRTGSDSYQARGRKFFLLHRIDLNAGIARLRAEYSRLAGRKKAA